MTNSLICLFEDENKNCVKWCYPLRFAKNLTLACAVDIWLYLQYYWADLAQICSLGPLAMSRILSLRLIHAMHALTSNKLIIF